MTLTELFRKLWGKWDNAFRGLFLFILNLYKVALRPYLGCSCCYQPSCSSYSITALKHHNIFKASFLIFYRVLRCNPFSRGGIDPVPGVKSYE